MCHSVSQSLGDCNSRDATYEVVSYMSSYSPSTLRYVLFTQLFFFYFREQITVGRLKAIDMLLQMLLLVVEQPGQMALSLLPAILNLSLNYVTPLLAQECNSSDFCDVAISLYALFDG